MKKIIKLGLLGSGTVGTGVVRVLNENKEDIVQKIGADIEIKKILVRDVNKKREYLEGIELTDKPESILNDPDIDIVIEVMGGKQPALDYMLKAMESGKHVVTANKDVVAAHGKELFAMAEAHNTALMFEASVGGGIPIITPLKHCLTANKITEIMGILNGTTNYMLTKMTQDGCDYDSILKEAQAKGYAEANPAADVGGLDAARKAAILASIAFNTRVSLDDVSVEGITNIEPADIQYATQLGYSIKLLAIARDYGEKGINVRVHPVFLPKEHPLSNVNDVFNAIFIKGNAIGEAMFYGRGAGSLPTASAVMADIVEISRNLVNDTGNLVGCTCYKELKICPVEETEDCYYVRLRVNDESGVLGQIATAFGQCNISMKSVIQTRMVGNFAEIVAVTHITENKKIKAALNLLQALPVVDEISSVLRVENA